MKLAQLKAEIEQVSKLLALIQPVKLTVAQPIQKSEPIRREPVKSVSNIDTISAAI